LERAGRTKWRRREKHIKRTRFILKKEVRRKRRRVGEEDGESLGNSWAGIERRKKCGDKGIEGKRKRLTYGKEMIHSRLHRGSGDGI
jgi:hypothetical protein